jgi:glyoxylase-like metal-dependent hydrolase (beta-lactamase superfamily II)
MVPANAKKWAKEAAKYGPIRYVINTEPHGDHISGNCYFGGKVIAHEGTRDAILASKVEDFENMLKMMAPDSLPIPDDFRYRPPDITLSERLTFYLGDHTFKLIHLPGHSPYQIAVYVPEERIVFTSDNVVVGNMPFFGPSIPNEWLKSLKEYDKLDVDKVVPGHGPVADKSCFKQMYKIVKGCLDAVRAAIAKGMSLEEAQEKVSFAEILPGVPEHMKGVTRMNVGRLYEYLKK